MASTLNDFQFPAGARVAFRAGKAGRATLVRPSDGEAVGNLCYTLERPRLTIDGLEVAAAHRGYGIGSEAARLVVEGARSAGIHVVRAIAPGHLGLSVYFWTRMGFRPLHGEAPGEGIWFERALD